MRFEEESLFECAKGLTVCQAFALLLPVKGRLRLLR
jgi:hypothetical protein